MAVTVSLQYTAAANPAERSGSPQGALAGARILVVEDEFLIALQLQEMLEAEGAGVIGPCSSLSDALEQEARADISAATLDLNLGRELATPVAEALTSRHIPFLFYSVQTRDPALAAWSHVPLVQKPARPEEFIRALAQLRPAH